MSCKLKSTVIFYSFTFNQFLLFLLAYSMGWQLHGTHGHSHGGGVSHAHGENINVRAAFIHVLGDVLQSIGVFCAAIIIYFKPNWQLADPICTFIFSLIVLCTTITIMKDALLVSAHFFHSFAYFRHFHSTFTNLCVRVSLSFLVSIGANGRYADIPRLHRHLGSIHASRWRRSCT